MILVCTYLNKGSVDEFWLFIYRITYMAKINIHQDNKLQNNIKNISVTNHKC